MRNHDAATSVVGTEAHLAHQLQATSIRHAGATGRLLLLLPTRLAPEPAGWCDDAGMRLFVAPTPPEAVAEELAARVAPLRALAPELRWSRPEQWYLTLAFLGEVAGAAREDMASRLERAARHHAPLPLSFAGARTLRQPRAVGGRGDRKALRRLAESVRADNRAR